MVHLYGEKNFNVIKIHGTTIKKIFTLKNLLLLLKEIFMDFCLFGSFQVSGFLRCKKLKRTEKLWTKVLLHSIL